jgi:hypothetical protein
MISSLRHRALTVAAGVVLIGLAGLTVLGSAAPVQPIRVTSFRRPPVVVATTFSVVQSGPEVVAPVIPLNPLPGATPRPTPTPTPVPTPKPAPRAAAPVVQAPVSNASNSGGDVVAIITSAAQADGVDPNWLISTAECESGLNPNAYNGAGPYDGLFQFLPSTFRAHGGTDIWDPSQQAAIAASMFAQGESSQWPVCSRR